MKLDIYAFDAGFVDGKQFRVILAESDRFKQQFPNGLGGVFQATAYAHQLQGNLLLVYGTGNDNCHYQNCRGMVNELVKHNKQFSQVSYPNCGHGLDEGENTRRHLFEILTRYLGDNLPVTHFWPTFSLCRLNSSHLQVRRESRLVFLKFRAAYTGASAYDFGLTGDETPFSYCALTHGTGHGVGLDVHEPPLLEFKGPALLAGEVLTVEPGLYRRDLGGVRIEDMVVVTEGECANLNTLSDELCWK